MPALAGFAQQVPMLSVTFCERQRQRRRNLCRGRSRIRAQQSYFHSLPRNRKDVKAGPPSGCPHQGQNIFFPQHSTLLLYYRLRIVSESHGPILMERQCEGCCLLQQHNGCWTFKIGLTHVIDSYLTVRELSCAIYLCPLLHNPNLSGPDLSCLVEPLTTAVIA